MLVSSVINDFVVCINPYIFFALQRLSIIRFVLHCMVFHCIVIIRLQALQPKYATFTDYTTILAQLGFVVIFAAVFPLGPLLALLNNIILMRLNAYKLCHTRQRPIAQKSGGEKHKTALHVSIAVYLSFVMNCDKNTVKIM